MQIRAAAPGDAPALGRLHVRAWQWAYRGMLPDDYLDGLADQTERREAMWRQVIGQPPVDQSLRVAEDEGRLVGFCHTAPARDGTPETAELFAIYLDPDVVGTGVGAALMRQALSDMRASGGGELRLGARREPIRVVELPDDQKPEVLRAYLRRWRFEVGVFFQGVGPEAPEEELRRIAPDYPVFRLLPDGAQSSATR